MDIIKNIFLNHWAELFALFTGTFFYFYLDKIFRVIFYYVIISFLIEVIGVVVKKKFHSPNGWVYNLYFVIEFGILIFVAHLSMQKKYFKLIGICCAIFLTVLAWNIFFIGIKVCADSLIAIEEILILTVYFFVLYQQSLKSQTNIYRSPIFWLCISIIIFDGCSIAKFSVDEIKLPAAETKFLNNFIYYLNDIFYLFIAYAFYLSYRNNKDKQTVKPNAVQ